MTFSIVAADPAAHEVGVATQSKFLAVGAVVPWARGDVGAVATQSFAEVTFGPRGLDLLAEGLSPQAALDRLLAADDESEKRQVGMVDREGRSASWTGSGCFAHASSVTGEGFACQGNIMVTGRVVPDMAEAFQAATGALADRMLEALRAAQRAGGDRRGQEAAAMLIAKPGGGYGSGNDRYLDLRVDHHDEPIEELARLLELHRLYFDRPREEDLVTADTELEAEITERLRRLGKLESGQEFWSALEDYLGWENLEERWAGPGRIDRRVLEYLRRHSGGV